MHELEKQLEEARRTVVTDGYEMSFGELVSLYKSKELTINPEYQRLYRWDLSRKTSFVESILLGIPMPPLFVFQLDDGTWELINGLQRTSTVLEFMGELVEADGNKVKPLELQGTKLLPSIEGVVWQSETKPCLSSAQKLDFRRARIRLEILKRASDNLARFELFRRLNTGGLALSEQEVRNCTLAMLNPEFFDWLKRLAQHETFKKTTALTPRQLEKQFGT